MRTKLSMGDIKAAINEAYSMAKYTGDSPANKIAELKSELNSRTPSGRRRYPLFMANWASGYDSAKFDHMMSVQLECIRVNEKTGQTFTTDKSGRSTLPRIPADMHREVALNPDWKTGMRFIETGRAFKN